MSYDPYRLKHYDLLLQCKGRARRKECTKRDQRQAGEPSLRTYGLYTVLQRSQVAPDGRRGGAKVRRLAHYFGKNYVSIFDKTLLGPRVNGGETNLRTILRASFLFNHAPIHPSRNRTEKRKILFFKLHKLKQKAARVLIKIL